MSGSDRAAPIRRGFTLLEILVTLSVISVLIALMLPAIAGGRGAGSSVACQANLRSIGSIQAAYAGDSRGAWPNAFGRATTMVTWTLGSTQYDAHSAFSQVWLWCAPLVEAGMLDIATEMRGVSCPVVAERLGPALARNPQNAAIQSYAYSPAFLSSPDLWDPERPERRREPEPYRTTVTMASVAFPSGKVAVFEWAEHHGSSRVVTPDLHLRVNASFADGHVRAVSPAQAQKPLEFPWSDLYGPGTPPALPFSSSPWGSAGRDY